MNAPVGSPGGTAEARSPGAPDGAPAQGRDRGLDRADGVRRLQRRAGVEALVRELLDPGLLVLRGEPADAEGLRHGRAGAARRGLPQRRRCHQAARNPEGGRGSRRGQPRLARLVLLLDRREPRLRLEGRPHDVRRDLPAEEPHLQLVGAPRRGAGEAEGRNAGGRAGLPDRARPALRRLDRRLERGPERAHGGADRRPRLPRDPVLRLRHVAGGADADRGGDRGDPEHLHVGLDPDLHHQRLDHRSVPDRARRPGRGDRLRAADDLPLPRRAARGRGRRDGARRDDDARGPLGDRLGLDRGRRACSRCSCCRCRSSARSGSAAC